MNDQTLDQLRINIMRFLAKSEEYRSSVLPRDMQALVPLDAASTQVWERRIGMNGTPVGIWCVGLHRNTLRAIRPGTSAMVDEAIILVGERQT
ncbi:hypothetical protein FIM08_03405 [SAR202 cluster bacterium AC-647-N09_OGT_505m]|nr:hypothetical protein [SAR202 cluster bacterium AC-647-N09_OGT_505m]